ncbi:MAG: dihydropteroate synthase [Vicinamibacteria bacterium]|jgi:dihydropteroate synthase|nr:dihydropteroate synthase [Vicinamibacteria bacterium]
MTERATSARRPYRLALRDREVQLGERTLVMGVLNVTADSFSDGGRYLSPEAAITHGLRLFAAGADIVDVGGQSSRPQGAQLVSAEEEQRRVVPVIAGLRQRQAGLISIDTFRASVAGAALDAGADLINDISALRLDPQMAALAASRRAGLILMHSRGAFAALHDSPHYSDVMGEVSRELRAAMAQAETAGVAREALILDPGIGFSKNAAHSLEVMRRLTELHALNRPILVGPSRKSFIGHVTGAPAERRLFGTAAAVALSIQSGAHIVRVHDVLEIREVARVSDAICVGAS